MSRLANLLEWIVCALFAAMLAVGLFQVVNRYAIGLSIGWTEEAQRYLHVWFVFLAIPLALRAGANISLQLLKLNDHPRLDRAIARFCDVLWFLLGVALVVTGTELAWLARTQESPALELSMTWIYAALVVGGALIALFAIHALTSSDGESER